MKRRARKLLILSLPVLAVLLWFEPMGVIRGWVRGEAFFRGRPTNYWRSAMLDANALSPFA